MLTMRKLVKKVCAEIGFADVTEAADGALAWDVLNATTPPIQLVISDWNMPNMSGLDFLKKVRADAKWAKLPFLLVTAEAEQKQVVEAVKAGVTNYVVKPFSADLKESSKRPTKVTAAAHGCASPGTPPKSVSAPRKFLHTSIYGGLKRNDDDEAG